VHDDESIHTCGARVIACGVIIESTSTAGNAPERQVTHQLVDSGAEENGDLDAWVYAMETPRQKPYISPEVWSMPFSSGSVIRSA
jgi:hypothetical protein